MDTSVIVEYLDEDSPYADAVEALYWAILKGKVEAIIPVTTISEVLSIAARVYERSEVREPQ